MTVAYEHESCFGRASEESKVELTLEDAKVVCQCVEHEYLRLVLESAPCELIAHIETIMYALREKIRQVEKRE
jgi:hypothetical protein